MPDDVAQNMLAAISSNTLTVGQLKERVDKLEGLPVQVALIQQRVGDSRASVGAIVSALISVASAIVAGLALWAVKGG